MNYYLRIAGNTEAPCYYALLEKGYEVKILSCHISNNEGTDCRYEFEARKKGHDYIISATSIYKLLALVVMGEIRGFAYSDWKLSREEIDSYFDMKDRVPTYDFDGNLIEEE